METLFASLSATLLVAAILTMVSIVRDVFPSLDEEDRASYRGWVNSSGSAVDRAIGRTWKAHVRLFPESRKRLLFAGFLIAASLSVMAYPLWLFLTRGR